MKDLKLPIMSNEDREKSWENLKEGDTLVHIEYVSWGGSYNVRSHKVVKRTPKGSIRLSNDELLKSFSHDYHVVTKELEEWFDKITLEHYVMQLMFEADKDKKAFKDNLTYDDAMKLKEILERIIPNKEK